MKYYSKAPDECADRVAHLLKLFHPTLVAAKVTFDLLSVADEEGESCLTHQGYPAAAVVRVVDPKGRTMGRGDVEIVIDEVTYMGFTDPEKDALLDHELYHVELQLNKKGRVKLDENGRPKLKLRKHDVSVGWFAEIAERHGAASMERKQALQICLSGQQTFFAFSVHEHAAIAEAHVFQIEAGKPVHEPSDKVKSIAKEILDASPGVREAARNLVGIMKKHGATLTVMPPQT